MSFWRITLDTNPDFCNLNCIMCEDHSLYSASRTDRKIMGNLRPIMPKDMLEKVIREAAAIGIREIIPSTMGEPLLYPFFDTFLDLCDELGLSLNLTTNGTFPSKEKDQNVEYWAKRIIPIASDIKISWNGSNALTQSKIMPGSSLDQHVDNAKRFIAIRDELVTDKNYCSMTMQLTFMRTNLEEIPNMLELAINLGFDRLKGHQLWDHFPELEKESLRNDMLSAERWNDIVSHCHQRIIEHNLTSKRPFRLDNFFKLNLGQLDDIAPGGECPFLGREAWVDPNGRFNVCCAPDQQRRTLGDFGNVLDTDLLDLTMSEKYQELSKNYINHSLCKSCNMRRPV